MRYDSFVHNYFGLPKGPLHEIVFSFFVFVVVVFVSWHVSHKGGKMINVNKSVKSRSFDDADKWTF